MNDDLQNILEEFIQFSVDEALEIEEESWSSSTFVKEALSKRSNKYLTIKRTFKEVKIFDLHYKYIWSGRTLYEK